ncbi:MAG TPA: hemerythrin domain-containing protein, partial [Kofleriaceae bacterium]|nr:hemerythrin domain-containing protein [Kofleriaceae bacterium]
MTDPIGQLTHDHGELNRRVLALGTQVRSLQPANADADMLVEPLRELREQLFLHFAREEEGLFPFVTEVVVELSDQLQDMLIAHDTICGALARMVHLAQAGGSSMAMLAQLFDRFENAYATHAQMESQLLAELASRLDADHRA